MTDAATAENPRATVGDNKPPPLRDVLVENYSTFTREIEDIAGKANDAPHKIESDAALGRVGDIVKDARNLVKRIDQARSNEKEPHLTAGREIDAFFKAMSERVERIAKVLNDRATDYQRDKAAEERRRREAEARAAQEEADRQRRIAEDEAARNRPTAAARHEDKAEAAEEKAASATAAAQASAADLTRVRSEEGGTVASARTVWNFEITNFGKVDLEALRPYLPRADVEKAIRQFVRVNRGGAQLAGVRIYEDVKANFR